MTTPINIFDPTSTFSQKTSVPNVNESNVNVSNVNVSNVNVSNDFCRLS